MSPVVHWPMGPAGPRWVHQGDSGLYERYDPSIHADPSIFLDMCGVPFCSPGHVLSWNASLRPIRRCLCPRLIHRCSLNTPPEAGGVLTFFAGRKPEWVVHIKEWVNIQICMLDHPFDCWNRSYHGRLCTL